MYETNAYIHELFSNTKHMHYLSKKDKHTKKLMSIYESLLYFDTSMP